MATMTRWEYRTYSLFVEKGREEWLAGLNALGDDGWEVCDDITIFASGGVNEFSTLLMKRQRL
jgi:hypothetical protein